MENCYIVTGAAGHLGGTILRLLQSRENKILGLLRTGDHPVVQSPSIRYIYGDVCKLETLKPLFADSRSQNLIVIHTAGLISIAGKVSPAVREVNVTGTANMIKLAQRYRVGRFVYVSSVHAIQEPAGGGIIREPEHFSPDLVTGGYAKTKAEATQLVLDASRQGLPSVVVHPSGIIGPCDTGRNHLNQLVVDYLRGKLPVCVSGGYDFVNVRDAAQGCLLAAEHGRPGQCYIINGQYLSIYELLTKAGQFGHRNPPKRIPMPLAKLAAPVIQAAARLQNRRPLYTSYSLYTLTSNSKFSRERAEIELGYQPRRIEETIRDTVHWLLENSYSAMH